MLAYDRPGTWSLKYNALEATWYAGRQQPYGVPLDPRHTYTKLDWELWTAAWVGGEVRDRLVAAACDYPDATPSRVPLSDWYETAAPPVAVGFAARPVVGGVYSLAVLHGPAHSTLYEATVLATPGLAGYWRLGERSGTRAADATGRHDGTYVGAPR